MRTSSGQLCNLPCSWWTPRKRTSKRILHNYLKMMLLMTSWHNLLMQIRIHPYRHTVALAPFLRPHLRRQIHILIALQSYTGQCLPPLQHHNSLHKHGCIFYNPSRASHALHGTQLRISSPTLLPSLLYPIYLIPSRAWSTPTGNGSGEAGWRKVGLENLRVLECT